MSRMTRRRFLAVAGGMVAGAPRVVGMDSDGRANATPSAGASGPDFDSTVWREYGTPLIKPTGSGPLDGQTIAVKDLYAIKGHRIGAGNELWLQQAEQQTTTASAVAALLSAGVAVAGIARTVEFAYSLTGTNGHYGTPPNPSAPDRLPGGSSSGSASAVALGQATIGMGSDTAGSTLIPSSYQGLYGIRTTHGAISRDGLFPLAPSFDTVGWMTRTRDTLAQVAGVLEPNLPDSVRFPRAVYADSLLDLANADVAATVRGAIEKWTAELPIEPIRFDVKPLSDWAQALLIRVDWEAWQAHGTWIEQHWDSLNPDIRSKFETASKHTTAELSRADAVLKDARSTIDGALGDAVLILPTASSVALPRDSAVMGGAEVKDIRTRTFQLLCLAGITGRPAVSSPLAVGGPPIGICAVGPRDSDRALAALRIGGTLI
ncbi:MAG: glutamyl-tRNA amidotransferase [Mycobacterium sp.]|nr:glutamyl-tRNA amidotransferase [Mycobacterium sp.]